MFKIVRACLLALLLFNIICIQVTDTRAQGAFRKLVWIGRLPYSGIAWSPDGIMLAVQDYNGVSLYIGPLFDKLAKRLAAPTGVESITWSPQGNSLAAVNGEAIWIWDVATNQKYVFLSEHHTGVSFSKIAWSRDGERFICGNTVWNKKTGSILATLENVDVVEGLAWSPDGTRIATADGTARIWDGANYRLLATLPTQFDVRDVSWSPDSRLLAAVSYNKGTIEIWDTVSNRLVTTLAANPSTDPSGYQAVAWKSDGNYLATADEQIHIWNAKTWKQERVLKGLPDGIRQLDWNRNGILASFGQDLVRLWNESTGEQLRVLGANEIVTGPIAWSGDSREFAVGMAGEDRGVQIRDATTGKLVTKFDTPNDVNLLAWHPKNSWLATSDSVASVRILDRNTGQLLHQIDDPLPSKLVSISWRREGTQLAAFNDKGAMQIWDTVTWETVRSSDSTEYYVDSNLSPDGTRLANFDEHREAHILDSQTGTVLVTLQLPSATFGPYHTIWGNVAFSWNSASDLVLGRGLLLMSPAVSRTFIWDTTTGNLLYEVPYASVANSTSWNPDGKRVAIAWDAGHGQGTDEPDSVGITIYNVVTKQTTVFHAQSGVSDFVAWSPDGKHLISQGDYTVSVWGQ